MKEKTKETQEANFKIASFLGLTWAEAVKLSQVDRDFLFEKACEVEVKVEEQAKLQDEQAKAQEAAQRAYMEQAYQQENQQQQQQQQQQQPVMQQAQPHQEPVRELQPWGQGQ